MVAAVVEQVRIVRGDSKVTRRLGWPALALFVLTLVAFLPAFRSGFIWDDDSYVEHNATLRSLPGLAAIWIDTSATPQYYPLVHTSFWIEYHLWGAKSAAGFHAVNILLQCINALLLWQLLRRLAVPGAWVIAAIFAVHPLQVETVGWITERKNLLSACFYFLSIGSYLRWVGVIEPDDGSTKKSFLAHGHRRYLASLIFFLLALFSKTVAATMPAAILLTVWWKRGNLRWKDVRPLIPFFVLGLGLGSVTGYLERTQVGAHGPEWSALTPLHRALIAGRAISFYAGKLLLPFHQSFIYHRWNIEPHLGWQYLFPVGVVAIIVLTIALRNRIGRGPATAVLFFAGTLFPALGFANVYPMRYSFVADHFQYLASVGFIALIVGVFIRICPGPAVQRVVAFTVIVILASCTFVRSQVYHDRLTLWRDTIANNPTSWMAHTNLGHALHDAGEEPLAEEQYVMSLSLAPQLPEPHFNAGVVHAVHRDFPAARAEFEKVIEIDPGYAPAYASLAQVALNLNDFNTAELQARKAIAVSPGYANGHKMLGRVFQLTQRLPQALVELETAVRNDPDEAETHFFLADALVQSGHGLTAIPEYEASLALKQDNPPAWTTLGRLLLAMGRRSEAAGCFRRALQYDPHLIPAQHGLAQTLSR